MCRRLKVVAMVLRCPSFACLAISAGAGKPLRPGCLETYQAREVIAEASFARARVRLAGAKRRRELPEEAEAVDRRAGEMYSRMQQLTIGSSQFGDDRPLSAIQVRGSRRLGVLPVEGEGRRGQGRRGEGLAWARGPVSEVSCAIGTDGEVSGSPEGQSV